MNTTCAAIWTVMKAEIAEDEREEILRPLASAFMAAHQDDEDASSAPLNEVEAHVFYLDAYYTAAKDLRSPADGNVNPREVSVPEWCPTDSALLRLTARHERQRDEAALRYMRMFVTSTPAA